MDVFADAGPGTFGFHLGLPFAILHWVTAGLDASDFVGATVVL